MPELVKKPSRSRQIGRLAKKLQTQLNRVAQMNLQSDARGTLYLTYEDIPAPIWDAALAKLRPPNNTPSDQIGHVFSVGRITVFFCLN
ncbi:hypothetical protein FAES_3271 [Fibrella aestuarina BUZ 2]|uniref:Uncharacterized protein n=1 Tax=Fibrella aestuarina BUZ 2 TaxID=1166018 RepID=I0KAX7_9BACT|nr:hypothetical protein [Fibrella aestuarina]CCH01280.1 hypothetical protein FAES_3271 [Fibrella aestuarina BUZ 2]